MRSRRASRRHCILCFVAVLLTGSLAGEAARARPPSRTGVRANDPASSADSTSSEASPSNKFVSWAEGEHFTGEWGACETGWPTGDRHRILLRSRLVGPAGWRHKGSGYRPQSFRRQCQLRSRAAVQALGRHGVHRCLWATGVATDRTMPGIFRASATSMPIEIFFRRANTGESSVFSATSYASKWARPPPTASLPSWPVPATSSIRPPASARRSSCSPAIRNRRWA